VSNLSRKNETVVRLAGYAELIARYKLAVIENWHESAVAGGNISRIDRATNIVKEVYPSRYWPGDSVGDHLEFALKYDGANLGILSALFKVVKPGELLRYIQSKPVGKYARKIWYLYEFITGNRLDLDDLGRGNYVDLLDAKKYYTAEHGKKISRQRINDNLLGDTRFCPVVRKAEALKKFETEDLKKRCQDVLAEYPLELLKRALSYLYTKETRSSFEIEHLKPNPNRTERFVGLLQLAEQENFCEKRALIELQNRIVEKRFADSDYRSSQNYVGEMVMLGQEKIHFVSPRPEDISDLMAGLIASNKRLTETKVHPVLQAGVIAFGFVFLHPFEDGNGRIHRFLIHNVLARSGFTPEGIMFPVSAAMLANISTYDKALEAFSKPLMQLVDYSIDEDGRMTVNNDTADFYRFIDMTEQIEALFGFIEATIETELTKELMFLQNYDRTKHAIQDIADMPDRLIDLFIRFCLQNNGKLSERKRQSHFAKLTIDEIERMQQIVCEGYRSIS